MERILGGIYDGKEYLQAMHEAKQEYQEWLNRKYHNRVTIKEKYRAQRLAKLAMQQEQEL